MKPICAWCAVLAMGLWIAPTSGSASEIRELKVHLTQANNDSPYAFLRAKFEAGEVVNPWAVRFIDEKGIEVPFFVWDSVTWSVAREGREDWGHRFALINHGPGDAPEVLKARGEKLQWARKNLPELADKLEAADQAGARAPQSICAAMYLLRYHVPNFGKQKLTLQILDMPRAEPIRQKWNGQSVVERVSIRQGDLSFTGLPDRAAVTWQGKEIFRYAGFKAANATGTLSHADPMRPFSIEKSEGIITKLFVAGQTDGRNGAPMDWQCTYWLFPEGGCVALEGFNMADPAGYMGGAQKLSILESISELSQSHKPTWETPWWLHHAADAGFIAIHLFHALPLTIGYGNNPFTVNPEGNGKDPNVESAANQLTLAWSYQLNEPAIMRVQAPEPAPSRGPRGFQIAQPPLVNWKPKIDWLYRQYIVAVGNKSGSTETAMRDVLGAAAGWIDRPIDEEALAATLVETLKKLPSNPDGAPTQVDQLVVVPMVLNDNAAAARSFLMRARNQGERADWFADLIREHVRRGGTPTEGRRKDDPDGTRREGWTGNAAYHAVLLPTYLRVFDFFELPYRDEAYRQALLRFADFTLELVGGQPFDLDKWNQAMRKEWPSRVVPAIPLMLHAYSLKPDERYAGAARRVFDDVMQLVERNPHGYFPAWSFTPVADKWDTVYNVISFERGVASFWSEQKLDLIGRDRASHFVSAQARWMVFSGQLLDTLEIDNVCAIRAAAHHEHTAIRNQLGIYLYDDFEFYRGLFGGIVDWSAATWQIPGKTFPLGTGPYRSLEIADMGSPMLRWALDIRPGARWLESKVQPLAAQKGFKLQVWNRLPGSKPTVKVLGKEIGLASESEVLRVEPSGPAYRLPAEFEIIREAGKAVVRVSRAARIRLSYGEIWPELTTGAKPLLRLRHAGGASEIIREGIVQDKGAVEWTAAPGVYELGG